MRLHEIAIVGVLLATGSILRYFLAMLNTPLTPNVIIAFYCLAIIVVKQKYLRLWELDSLQDSFQWGSQVLSFPRLTLSANL